MSEFRKATKLTEVAAAVDLMPLGWGDPRYVDISAGRGKNADFRGVVTCLIDTQFLPEDPAISRGFVGP
jgi:hypothetical protein